MFLFNNGSKIKYCFICFNMHLYVIYLYYLHFWFDRRKINWKGVLNLVCYFRARPKGLCHLGVTVHPCRSGEREFPHQKSIHRRTTNSRRYLVSAFYGITRGGEQWRSRPPNFSKRVPQTSTTAMGVIFKGVGGL